MGLPAGMYKRYKNSSWLWISYQDEYGRQIKEAAHTQDAEIAADFRKLRMAQVAERRLIPTRQYEQVTFGELLDFWWERHAKHHNNKFEYILFRLNRFKPMKARHISPEMVQDFLYDLLEKDKLSPSSVNHYRSIFNSTFNFAIKWKKYDDNPVRPVQQIEEREPRDRFVEVEELGTLIEQCQRAGDFELQGFIILAACTGLRKGAILPRKWTEVRVDDKYPFIHMPKRDSKNKRPARLPLPKLAVVALKQMPSYGKSEYLFPAKPNVKYKDAAKFSKPYTWDLGKRFKRVCTKAGINDLRIHDLRHFATTMLFIEGVPDEIIRKLTGHRSEELQRYKHFSAPFLQETGERIAGKLEKHISTFSGTKPNRAAKSRKATPKGSSQTPDLSGFNGGADGTRTRDLRRDRPAF
jgi:integrase